MSEWDDAWTKEEDFVSRIIEMAEDWLGWRVAHFRPAKTRRGWRTPVQGSLGKGFPDLVMVKPGRILVAEVKSDRPGAKLSLEQEDVLQRFRIAGAEVHVWRPSDWDAIVSVLQGARPSLEGTLRAAIESLDDVAETDRIWRSMDADLLARKLAERIA